MPLAAGTRLGPYEISSPIGKGGMGEVYRARDPRLAREVIKILAEKMGERQVGTGLPAKSGVSGVIVGVAPGRAGIAVASPRVNTKGGSVRGHAILRELSRTLWPFALPGP